MCKGVGRAVQARVAVLRCVHTQVCTHTHTHPHTHTHTHTHTDANATVAVPNSLGPGELLVRYGTPEQQQYFLPRLASGQLIPCFGLTGVCVRARVSSGQLIPCFGLAGVSVPACVRAWEVRVTVRASCVSCVAWACVRVHV